MISFHLIKGCFSQRNYWTKSSKWWSCVCLLCLSLSCVWCSQCSHCLWVIYFWLPLLFSLTFISDIPLLRHFIILLLYCCDTHLLWHYNIPTFLCSYFPLYMSRHYFIVYIQHIFSVFIIIYHIWNVHKRLLFAVITKVLHMLRDINMLIVISFKMVQRSCNILIYIYIYILMLC